LKDPSTAYHQTQLSSQPTYFVPGAASTNYESGRYDWSDIYQQST